MDRLPTQLGRGRLIRFLEQLGKFGILLSRVLRAFSDFPTYGRLIVGQMRTIGMESLPLVVLTAVFVGMVASIQTAYQLQGRAPLYLTGSAVSKMIFLGVGPVTTALVLSGRVGASIAAQLGTMKITEQIDALESMAFNALSYLVVPRVIAGMIMLPILVIFADAIAIAGAWLTAVLSAGLSSHEFFKGLQMFFLPMDIIGGLIKAFFFGLTITLVPSFYGFNTTGGAEGVGRATTNAVVVCCLSILVLDYIIAAIII
ncbi:MAG: ABC transporter permease [Candidatus Latescibacteria bacterium]|nr:ABC transporter permease [Candidatus Latescibacterota bacterium]